MHALVLLSGGMDSCVALFAAAHLRNYESIGALFINYGQTCMQAEHAASLSVWRAYKEEYGVPGVMNMLVVPPQIFVGDASILGRSSVNDYDTPEAATAGTHSDRADIPFRNGIFIALAGHHLAVRLAGFDGQGEIITGMRGRPATEDTPALPDCTAAFIEKMGAALAEGLDNRITTRDILNHHAPSRAGTLNFARALPGCWHALGSTVSCYNAVPDKPTCGRCLPCRRRAAAFVEIGEEDPASWRDL